MKTEKASTPDLFLRPFAVIGTGTLGRRIALMLATQGVEVRIFGRAPEGRRAAKAYVDEQLPGVLERIPHGTPGPIVLCDDLASAVTGAGLVVESVPEQLELKKRIFGELDRLSPPDAILASNSSSYAASRFIEHVQRPERVVNTHFYLPPQMTAVEVMSCGKTAPEVIETLMQVLPRFGLDPYHVKVESTGFIFNRIWAAIKRESLAVVAEGVSTPADIDAIYRNVFGTTFGPFQLMDQVGLDVVLDIEENYATERPGIPQGPRQVLREYIAQGRLGKKSGRGFYDY